MLVKLTPPLDSRPAHSLSMPTRIDVFTDDVLDSLNIFVQAALVASMA